MDASTNLDLPADQALPIAGAAPEKEQRRFEFNWNNLRNSPAFMPGLAILLALGAAFWSLIGRLPDLWFADDGYYSHGVLVPLISGYVVYRWWPWMRNIKVRPSYVSGALLLLFLGFIVRPSVATGLDQISSICLVISLLLSIGFIGGWRWMIALMMPTGYLLFGLPIWNMAITYYTNPLQTKSTDVAYKMLEFTGFNPLRSDNIIYLNNYQLDVGVPCSGLKLVLALYAFTVFFALIAQLRWWANAILLLIVPLPLALFVNGLRIMLIGVVGVNYGPEAGHKFHDYSGYIALVVCFFILFKIARWLGWKD